MKNILVLGAGLVSKPGVRYLLNQKNIFITVASRTVSKAEDLIEGFANGKAVQLNVSDEVQLSKLIEQNDIIVSLLPWVHHFKVANLCSKHNKHMATTSYVSDDMKKLNNEAASKNLFFLNEIGVDPGIDHMSAMKIIDEVYEKGAKVVHFYSYCGGLPAPEDNDNPYGYKFSWSPKGVVLASRNSGKFLENGKLVEIEGKDLFLNYRTEKIEGLGKFEVYPNRNSIPYKDLYNLKDALTVMRGTYRNLGWCDTLKKMVDVGLIDEAKKDYLNGITYRKMMAKLIGENDDSNIEQKVAQKLNLEPNSEILKRFEWLGLFSDGKVSEHDNVLDILSDLLQEKLVYKDNEKDMIILQHKFTVENADKSKDLITSTLIDYGIALQESSMARTVSLPLAIGVRFMAEEKFNLKGVHIPITKQIYEPVLNELETLGIKMVEKKYSLD
ncbi:MAG: saccharopine dehydrogenase NADP-binding domain-containing protein [Ignavibacteria bacterium]|nr:saccharopine dehydrogenase NADP-binding domain-containing protein [Ignavibacteria bacterium]NNL22774.1 saccharopine dehydrogenase [Ignavibacteriaceae bacterium]